LGSVYGLTNHENLKEDSGCGIPEVMSVDNISCEGKDLNLKNQDFEFKIKIKIVIKYTCTAPVYM